MPPSPAKPKSDKRIKAHRGGHRGEALAALFLQLKFYRIRNRRYRTPAGEIDIVAERFGTLVFVEVKARSKSALEAETLEGINYSRIIRAADLWFARHPRETGKDVRFDVIFLAPWRWPRHLINAFDGG